MTEVIHGGMYVYFNHSHRTHASYHIQREDTRVVKPMIACTWSIVGYLPFLDDYQWHIKWQEWYYCPESFQKCPVIKDTQNMWSLHDTMFNLK